MSNQQDMVGKLPPAEVADAFVKQYYLILNRSPENLYKFYQEPSLLGWPGPDGVVTPVTTLNGIKDMVMSSDYKYSSAEVITTDAQESLRGGIILAVSGCLTGKDNLKKKFSQTFFLAKQERGFYVLNDILQFFDVREATTNTAALSDDENNRPAPMQNSAPCSASDNPSTLDTEAAVENGTVEAAVENGTVEAAVENGTVEAAVENGTVEEQSDLSLSEDILANGAASTPSVASGERVVAPATNAKEQSVVAPATNAEVPSAVAPAKNAKALPAVEPATNAKVPSVVAPASNVTQKITYASMLAKETPVTSPRAAVTLNGRKRTMASPPTKASVPLDNGSPRASTPSSGVSKAFTSSSNPLDNGSPRASTPGSGVSKAFTSSSKVAPKSPTGGQGAPSTSAYAEARGIYIGGLPYNITKQGIVDVVKKFGPVRRYSDTVQIRRHEDGFCCGFVEFESADAARRAVETHHVMFGEKEAYITYKRSSYNRGSDGGARSPTRGGNRNGIIRGRENDDRTNNSKGQARGPRRSSSSDEWQTQAGRDRSK